MPDLHRPPLNAVGPPAGMHRRKEGRSGGGRLVLARMVWPRGTVVVPARMVWVMDDRAAVEWERHRALRTTWLPRVDVQEWMSI